VARPRLGVLVPVLKVLAQNIRHVFRHQPRAELLGQERTLLFARSNGIKWSHSWVNRIPR